MSEKKETRSGPILIADDNPAVQVALREILRRFGIETRVVGDGRAALESALEGGYALMLIDLQMPFINGMEATREIRRMERKDGAERLPVIVITGDLDDAVRRECLDAGADEVIAKPFSVEKLSGILDRWLRGEKPGHNPPRSSGKEGETPPAQPTASFASVNPGKLEEIRILESQGSTNLMRRMVELYRTGAAAHLEKLRRAARDRDTGALAAAAHEFKSSSSSVGGDRLSRLCSDIERLAGKGLLDGVEGLLPELRAEHQRVLDALVREVPPFQG